MAREAKATFDKELKEPEYKEAKESDDIKNYIKDISIDTKDCLRYCARVVKDVKLLYLHFGCNKDLWSLALDLSTISLTLQTM